MFLEIMDMLLCNALQLYFAMSSDYCNYDGVWSRWVASSWSSLYSSSSPAARTEEKHRLLSTLRVIQPPAILQPSAARPASSYSRCESRLLNQTTQSAYFQLDLHGLPNFSSAVAVPSRRRSRQQERWSAARESSSLRRLSS